MGHTANINARIDPQTKEKAVDVLDSLGINITQAISLFFKQIVYTKSIPFELKVPNNVTVETFEKTDAGEELNEVSDIDELKKELKV